MKRRPIQKTVLFATAFLTMLSLNISWAPGATASTPVMTSDEASKAAQEYLASFEMARCASQFTNVSKDDRNNLEEYIRSSRTVYMQDEDMSKAWFGTENSTCKGLMNSFYTILGSKEYGGKEDPQWSFMEGLGYRFNDDKTKVLKPEGESIRSNIESKYKTATYPGMSFTRSAENITAFDLQPESKYWLAVSYISQVCSKPSSTKPNSDAVFIGELRTISSDGSLGFEYVSCETREQHVKITPWLNVLPGISSAYSAKYKAALLAEKAKKFGESLCAESSAYGGANGAAERAECVRKYSEDYRVCYQENDYGVVDQDGAMACLEIRIPNRSARELQEAISGADSVTLDANIPEVKETSNSDGEGGTTACSAAIGGLGWIICPVVNLLSGLTDGLFGILSNFLETDSRLLGGEVEDSWAIFRNIANILLVVGFLIIIYSQLTSFGISNYGIKRMLPRLIIVAIAINLSLFLSRAMVDLSNVLGASLYEMLGGMLDTKQWSPGVGQTTSMILGGAATVAVVGVAANLLVVAGVGVLLAALLPAVAGLFVTVFILFARNALIVILAVISPIAVAAILLPNTESLFKKWWKVFFGLLLVYPMIAVVFGASKIAANVLVGIKGDWTMQIAAAAAATVPLLFTPKLLQSSLNATGSFGAKLGGIAGSLTKGATGGLRSGIKKGAVESSVGQGIASALKYRKQKRNIRWAGNRAKASGRMGSLYNTLGGDGYEQKRATQGVALEDKELEEEAAEQLTLIKSNLGPAGVLGTKNSAGKYVGGAGDVLEKALKDNDQARVKAATQLLLSSGGPGRAIIRQQVESFQNSTSRYASTEGYQAMQQTLNSAGLKGSDNVLAKVGYTKDKVTDITANKDTYSKLDDFEMAGQSDDDFKSAILSGAITRERAQNMLDNANLKLTPEKRNTLNNQSLFNQAVATPSTTTTPANPPTQPAAPQAPSPPTQPPSTP